MWIWLKSQLTEAWHWLFPEAHASTMGYSLLINANSVRLQNRTNRRAGEVIAVNEYDFNYGEDEKRIFTILRINDKITVEEAKAYWLKSGVPDSVQQMYDSDIETRKTDMNKYRKDKEDFDLGIISTEPKLPTKPTPINESLYPFRAHYVDLNSMSTDVPEVTDHLAGIDDYETRLATVEEDAKLAARSAVYAVLEASSSPLLETFDSLSTREIAEKTAPTTEEVATNDPIISTKDAAIDEIFSASRLGRKLIEDAEAAQISFVEEILVDGATLTKHSKDA